MNSTVGLVQSSGCQWSAVLPARARSPRLSLAKGLNYLHSHGRSALIRCESGQARKHGKVPNAVATSLRSADEAMSSSEVAMSSKGVGLESSAMEKEAWALLREAVVTYCGQSVGTIAANDPTDPFPLNYDQVFIRDFIPSALAFLLNGEYDIVRNFIHHTLQLQVHFVQAFSPSFWKMRTTLEISLLSL